MAANPWPVHREGTASDVTNLALFHLNLGLRAYQDVRLRGEAHRRADAVTHWQAYRRIAGPEADQRIVELMATIDTEGGSPRTASPAVFL